MTRNSLSLMERRVRPSRVYSAVLGAMAVGLSATTVGCLDRPVAPATPRTSNTLTAQVSVTAVDKIDLLFMIDNSSSMGDKESILSQAVGDLVNRLVDPTCVGPVDPTTQLPTQVAPAADKSCPNDKNGKPTTREFNAINDIHIGVVSSSLGGIGADSCTYDPTSAPGDQNNPTLDDHGHLVARQPSTTDLTFSMQVPTYVNTSMVVDGFLAWDPGAAATPPAAKNPGKGADTDAPTLVTKFSTIIQGVGELGCGFEQQMEGWYRFLVDPSPPSSVTGGVTANGPAGPTIGPIDTVLLQERVDFLRPDSLVAVIVVSDENEHSIIMGTLPANVCETPELDGNGNPTGACMGDPTPWPDSYRIKDNFNALGTPNPYNFASLQIYSTPATALPILPGTTACATDPYSPDCKDCLTEVSTPGFGTVDPNCANAYGSGPGGILDNVTDLRQWDMKRRFGWDAEYPIQRYVDGLHETAIYDTSAAAASGSGYALKVQNPLFDDLPFNAAKAANTPLTRGKASARDPKLVFLAGIVGVPWQDISNLNPTTMKPDLSQGYVTADKINWPLIVGDPYNADPTKRDPGDPLMIEAQNRDAAIAAVGGKHPVTGEPLGHTQWNSINGHEWEAYNGSDLQYTCFVALPTPTDCSKTTSCDCSPVNPMMPDPMLLQALDNPLCEPLTDPTNSQSAGAGQAAITGAAAFQQYRAHAYSGRRYLQALKGLSDAGGNSIVASICARNVAFADPAHANDPDLGYRPAVDAIIEQLKTQLKGRCLPRKLQPNADGSTPCLIIAGRYLKTDKSVMPEDVTTCNKCNGTARAPIPADIANVLAGDVTNYECLCEVTQLKGADLLACTTDPNAVPQNGGWCYVDPNAAGLTAAQQMGSESIVSKCPANQQQTIRFLNSDTNDYDIFITCLGAASGGVDTSGSGAAGAGGTGGLAPSGSAWVEEAWFLREPRLSAFVCPAANSADAREGRAADRRIYLDHPQPDGGEVVTLVRSGDTTATTHDKTKVGSCARATCAASSEDPERVAVSEHRVEERPLAGTERPDAKSNCRNTVQSPNENQRARARALRRNEAAWRRQNRKRESVNWRRGRVSWFWR